MHLIRSRNVYGYPVTISLINLSIYISDKIILLLSMFWSLSIYGVLCMNSNCFE